MRPAPPAATPRSRPGSPAATGRRPAPGSAQRMGRPSTPIGISSGWAAKSARKVGNSTQAARLWRAHTSKAAASKPWNQQALAPAARQAIDVLERRAAVGTVERRWECGWHGRVLPRFGCVGGWMGAGTRSGEAKLVCCRDCCSAGPCAPTCFPRGEVLVVEWLQMGNGCGLRDSRWPAPARRGARPGPAVPVARPQGRD